MIERLRELFSFYVTSPEQETENGFNISLVSCPLKEILCSVHFGAINDCLITSEKYRQEKDFNKSIETLKIAFEKSTGLLNHPCSNCVQHFRTKIYESLENVSEELQKRSKGFFGRKKYKSSYSIAKDLLKEFELAGAKNKFQINNTKQYFLGNHLN